MGMEFQITVSFKGEHSDEIKHVFRGLEVLAEMPGRLCRIEASIGELMATVAEIKAQIAAGQTVLAEHITTVAADLSAKFTALAQQIADLQAQVAAGQTLNPTDFQDLVDANTALAKSVDALDPNTPAPTNPVVAP